MSKLYKWIKKAASAILFFVVMTMAIQIWSVSDYSGGNSYVSYSPDGIYRMDLVIPPHKPTFMMVLTELDSQRVVLIEEIPTD